MPDLTFLMNVDPNGEHEPFLLPGQTVLHRWRLDGHRCAVQRANTRGRFHRAKESSCDAENHQPCEPRVGFGAIEGPITLASQAAGRTFTIADDLQDALAAKSLAPPGPSVITDKTRIVLYGCDVGRSLNFLKMLSGLFGDPGEVLAPRRLGVFKLDGSTASTARRRAGLSFGSRR